MIDKDIEALERGLEFFSALKSSTKERKPMTHAEADVLVNTHRGLTFAAIRAVEAAHGIV